MNVGGATPQRGVCVWGVHQGVGVQTPIKGVKNHCVWYRWLQ